MAATACASGVPRDRPFPGLAPRDVEALCDWTAGRIGGYGQTVTCSGGVSISSPASRAECIKDLQAPSKLCTTATVGVFEDCVNEAVSCSSKPTACFKLIFCAK